MPENFDLMNLDLCTPYSYLVKNLVTENTDEVFTSLLNAGSHLL